MIWVYAPGVWDLLHVGHLNFLEHARSLGDRLIVGVPSDEVVRDDKGAVPIIPMADRLRLLAALRCVDVTLPYYRLEFLTHLEAIRPQVLAVGEGWGSQERHVQAAAWAARSACRLVRIPYYHGESTTQIKERIKS